MVLSATVSIEKQKQNINDLNVFPVPDGDTGTNMSLTIGSAAAELRKQEPATVGKATDITASALLRGARGNSGVILSLLFRGLARSLKDKQEATAAEYAAAMGDGVEAAYKAVMKPAEGTILTVSRLAAAAAKEFAEKNDDIELMLEKAIEVGYAALEDTINLNPVLKKAGVIDAGGKGYLIILEGMLASLRGETIEDFEPVAVERREKAEFSEFDTGSITFGYCTEFIVSRENEKDPMLLWDFLGSLGDSAVVVDDDEIIKVHVHTNQPGVVITEALTYGSLLTVKIENMREQHTEMINIEAADVKEKKRVIAEPEKKYGAVAVCVGEGVEAVFTDLGVDFTITGGQTMNPSTEDILAEIDRTPAEIVYVFPNNSNIIMTAQQCIPLSEKTVIVIPTKTIPQGISALLAMNTSLDTEECTALMTEAIENVHSLQVTYAARDSDYDGCDIHEGDYLTFLEKRLLGTERDFSGVYSTICAALDEYDPEFITVFYGEDVNEEQANCCLDVLCKHFTKAEVTLIHGGQPVYYYMISAE